MSETTSNKNLTIETFRSAYGKRDIKNTFTVRELIEALEEIADEIGDEAPVYLSFDRGYTYGGIEWDSLTPYGINQDGDEEPLD